MSLKSTICIPNENDPNFPHMTNIGFVGISSLDHFVYVYQVKRKDFQTPLPLLLVIYQANPILPSSWMVFKQLELDKFFNRIGSTFNADSTKMAFRYFTAGVLNELWLLDMNNGEIEKQSVDLNRFPYHFIETSVGWVEVSLFYGMVSCFKTFPAPEENRILVTFADTDNAFDLSRVKTAGLTYDSLMYITFSNTQQHPWKLCKLVSYDFSSGNSMEIAFDQWNSVIRPYSGPILITNSNRSYLIRRSEDLGNRIYLVEHDRLGIKLTYLNQIDDQFISPYRRLTWFTTGNNKIAIIHQSTRVTNRKLLTVTNVTVQSLKSLAVWAIQNHYGHIGNNGELLDGISEEKLKKMIKYPENNKLF